MKGPCVGGLKILLIAASNFVRVVPSTMMESPVRMVLKSNYIVAGARDATEVFRAR